MLNNFGVLPWSLWFSLWRFWPVLLILIGVEIFIGRQVSFRTLIILFALIFLLPLALFLNPFGGNPLAKSKLTLNQNLATTVRAKITIDLPAVNLKIASLATDSAKLAGGQLTYSSTASAPTVARNEDQNTTYLNINQGSSNSIPFLGSIRNEAKIDLSPLVPLEILVKAAASNLDLNLEDLLAKKIDIQTAAVNLRIKYSSRSSKTMIRTGASSLNFEIPKDSATKILIKGGPKNISLPKDYFQKQGSSYVSSNFQNAKEKIEIDIEVGAGTISVRTY